MFRLPLAAVLSLALAGCDGGSDPPGFEFEFACEDIGFSSDGSLTADVDGDALRANCFDLRVDNEEIRLDGIEVRVRDFDIDIGRGIELDVDGDRPGTYEIGDGGGGFTGASVSLSSGTSLEAETGTIAVSEFSSSRLRGSFSFTTANGVRVTGGTFDIDL